MKVGRHDLPGWHPWQIKARGRHCLSGSRPTRLAILTGPPGQPSERSCPGQLSACIPPLFECNTVLTKLALERNNLDEYTAISAPYCSSGRLHDLHDWNRSLVPLSKRDGAIYAQPGLAVSLPPDVGELLSRFLILVCGSMTRYRDIMLDVHCALSALAAAASVATARKAIALPAGKSRAMRPQAGALSSSSMHARARPWGSGMRAGMPEVLPMSANAHVSSKEEEDDLTPEPDAGVHKRV